MRRTRFRKVGHFNLQSTELKAKPFPINRKRETDGTIRIRSRNFDDRMLFAKTCFQPRLRHRFTPIRQTTVVPGNAIGQKLSRLLRVLVQPLCAHVRMSWVPLVIPSEFIHSAIHISEPGLPRKCTLSQIMITPHEPRPIPAPERLGKFLRQVGDVGEMLFQRLPVGWFRTFFAVGVELHNKHSLNLKLP